MIRAYHDQHELRELMAQVVADHTDWHRIASERRERRERRTAASVGILSSVGAPFAIAYTAAVSLAVVAAAASHGTRVPPPALRRRIGDHRVSWTSDCARPPSRTCGGHWRRRYPAIA
jgi:hypothetical protein